MMWQQNNFVFEGHYNTTRKYIKGCSIRKVENHCTRRYGLTLKYSTLSTSKEIIDFISMNVHEIPKVIPAQSGFCLAEMERIIVWMMCCKQALGTRSTWCKENEGKTPR